MHPPHPNDRLLTPPPPPLSCAHVACLVTDEDVFQAIACAPTAKGQSTDTAMTFFAKSVQQGTDMFDNTADNMTGAPTTAHHSLTLTYPEDHESTLQPKFAHPLTAAATTTAGCTNVQGWSCTSIQRGSSSSSSRRHRRRRPRPPPKRARRVMMMRTTRRASACERTIACESPGVSELPRADVGVRALGGHTHTQRPGPWHSAGQGRGVARGRFVLGRGGVFWCGAWERRRGQNARCAPQLRRTHRCRPCVEAVWCVVCAGPRGRVTARRWRVARGFGRKVFECPR